MVWEVTKLAIAYLFAGAFIVVAGNALVRRVLPRVRSYMERHMEPTREKAAEVRVRATSLDNVLVRLECDLSDVYRPKRCSEVAR